MVSSSRTAPGRGRNWVELPNDVTASILSRLGAIEILTSAQMVCVTWRNICKDPLTWRTIDMRVDLDDQRHIHYDLEKMCRHAVDRSSGNLIDINVDIFGTDELLKYITDSSMGIKRLRLAHCYDITNEGLSEVASKLPLLEDLEISYCSFSHEPLEVVGASCPLLKSFKFNNRWYRWPREESNDDALAIAGTMHELRHLQLLGNKLTTDGLRAILDRCPHLESLDLRRCFNLKLGGKSGRRCAERIKKLRLPDDPIDNSELVDTDIDYGSNDEDNPSAFPDVDSMFDYDEYEFSSGNDYEDNDMDDYDVYPWLF
ncbi:F-box protein SKIP19 [Prunus yedoensis var. nudiflora]|uniref:F-box protein SKIP19 n=1 Tax=Prunus yedoensis var. nudiflora TaxID=2094558 RepID=A0A314YR47_PRUYE|nr:F-box protein SKIP19 [Prunus yedoensis var. nudiflora]